VRLLNWHAWQDKPWDVSMVEESFACERGSAASTGHAEPASALWPLAQRAADEGAYARVSELFAAAVQAGLTAQEAARWHQLLIEAGDFSGAREAERLAEAQHGAPLGRIPLNPPFSKGEVGAIPSTAPREQAVADSPPAADSAEFDDVIDFEPGAREPAEPAAGLVRSFMRWFAGRGDLYARQWYDARRDRSGYWPVREPLSARVIEQHLLGRCTVGQYVLHPDNTVSFAAVDLDPTAEALEQSRLAPGGENALASAPLAEYAARIMAAAERAGLAAMAEDTGGAGLHVWLLFAPRLAAARARALLRELLWRAGPQPPAVAVELFPKQDQLGGKGLGNLIKLPLGVHQVTLRPSRFIDAAGSAIEAEAALSRLRPCDPAAVEALLASRIAVLPVGGAEEEPASAVAPPPLPPADPTPRALAVALAAISPGSEAKRAADRIVAGCAVVRDLARTAHEEHRLSPDAARALLYTVGLVSRENEHIDALFADAGVSRKEIERARCGLQGPMGCKKLRERFPGRCQGCACPEAPTGGYATPALFALRRPVSLRRRPAPWPEIEPPAVSAAASGDIEQRLARIEAALERLVNTAGSENT
jgi:hypothetical protein